MFPLIDSALLILSFYLFLSKRVLNYLRYLQQDDYSPSRFLKWFWKSKSFDLKGSALCLLCCSFLLFNITTFIPLSIGLALLALKEQNPIHTGKIRLKLTERATRIKNLTLWLSLGLFCSLLTIFSQNTFSVNVLTFVSIQLIPFTLLLSLFTLSFGEKRLQAKFMSEATAIIKEINPLVIGITGSYGKTSSKHALSTVLQICLGATFWPEKGVNTPMGITREIRTKLKKGFRYAVIEMGAYGKGSISRICKLTPPQAALITGVGVAHLERFRDEETILKTKAELAESIPPNGILVCNGDNPGAREIAKRNPKKHLYFYGFDEQTGPLDCIIKIDHVTVSGTYFSICWQNQNFSGFTPLVGRPLISNIAGAFTMAVALKADPNLVIAALSQLTPVDNRLQIHEECEITYLRDAYNSNPIGFAGALEILSTLPGKRRILMTPGMIELGLEQENYNHKIGLLAGPICDIALVVGKTNQQALVQGLEASGMANEKIVLCETREHAFEKLKTILQKGDLVLIENDLPDLYEGRGKF